MEMQPWANEPEATSAGQWAGLAHLGEAQEGRVEGARSIFSALGHCDLDVVEAADKHGRLYFS